MQHDTEKSRWRKLTTSIHHKIRASPKKNRPNNKFHRQQDEQTHAKKQIIFAVWRCKTGLLFAGTTAHRRRFVATFGKVCSLCHLIRCIYWINLHFISDGKQWKIVFVATLRLSELKVTVYTVNALFAFSVPLDECGKTTAPKMPKLQNEFAKEMRYSAGGGGVCVCVWVRASADVRIVCCHVTKIHLLWLRLFRMVHHFILKFMGMETGTQENA